MHADEHNLSDWQYGGSNVMGSTFSNSDLCASVPHLWLQIIFGFGGSAALGGGKADVCGLFSAAFALWATWAGGAPPSA